MWRIDRILTLLGAVSIAIGLAAIGYAHLSAAKDLQRAVDVIRRLLDDGMMGLTAVHRTAAAADAVRAPSLEFTVRSIAALDPTIDALQALNGSLENLPGVGKPGAMRRLARKILPGDQDDEVQPDDGLLRHLEQLRRATEEAMVDARRLRVTALEMQDAMQRQEIESFQPTLLALQERLRETRAILTEANPARGITVLIDLIAGTYVVIGGALVLLGRAMARGSAAPRA